MYVVLAFKVERVVVIIYPSSLRIRAHLHSWLLVLTVLLLVCRRRLWCLAVRRYLVTLVRVPPLGCGRCIIAVTTHLMCRRVMIR